MTTTSKLPPRKGVTAWSTEKGADGFDDDPPFLILTLHHGLGEMTRVDLSAEEARDLAAALIAGAASL